MRQMIPYNKVIDALEKQCADLSLGKTYRGLELSEEFMSDVAGARTKGTDFLVDPMLPIDLVAVNDTKPRQYRLFWYVSFHKSKGVISENDDAQKQVDKLAEKIQFYQFYLSRVLDLSAIKIILVISQEMKSVFETELLEMTNRNGFGLWKLEIEKKPDELSKSYNFREHMEEIVMNTPNDMVSLSDSVKSEAPKIGPYFDRFVREAVDALGGRTLMQAGKRYISRQILDLALSLENVSYSDDLKRLVTNHLQEKGDDFEFVNNAFSELWDINFPDMKYSKFLKNSEIPLYSIFATSERPYRDHYVHQFQVFVLGSCIIDKLISGKSPSVMKRQDLEKLDKQWLITSSFHDVAYPLELYDKWAKNFFDESLDIPDIGELDIKSYFVNESLLSSLGFIINSLCERHFNGSLKGNWLNQERGLLLFFYDRMTKQKHHCILSSISLLKQAQVHCPDKINEFFAPSALAIALHHYGNVFKKLFPKDEGWKSLPDSRKIRTIDFATDPLSFLLMFCDCVQDWGRPKLANGRRTELEGWQTFVLKDCNIEDSSCCVKLASPRWNSIDEGFKRMDNELGNLEKMLRRPRNFDFRVTLFDRLGAKREHNFICDE